MSNFMKIRPLEAEFFRAGRHTDRHEKANIRLSYFCERAYKKVSSCKFPLLYSILIYKQDSLLYTAFIKKFVLLTFFKEQ
jgi:hypothetical protein